jgi:hypothetical protein
MRLSRRIRVSCGIEDSYAGSTVIDTPILWRGEPKWEIEGDMVDRDLVRDFLGAAEQIPANARSKLTGQTELWAAGAAGTAPAWGGMMRACGMAETISAGNRVEYTPVSQSLESLRLKVNNDGVQYITKGNVGTATLTLEAGALPVIDWDFRGVKVAHSEVAFGTPSTMAAWKKPQVIRDENAGALLRSCTYTAGALATGSVYNLRSMKIDLGNTIDYSEELTNAEGWGQRQMITKREVTGEALFAVTAAQEVAIRNDIANGVEASLGFKLGSVAGQKLVFFGRAVQLTTPQMETYNGMAYLRCGCRFLPSATGNDEFILAVM